MKTVGDVSSVEPTCVLVAPSEYAEACRQARGLAKLGITQIVFDDQEMMISYQLDYALRREWIALRQSELQSS